MGTGLPAGVRRELSRLADLVPALATGSPAWPAGAVGSEPGDPPAAHEEPTLDVAAGLLYAHWYLVPPPELAQPVPTSLPGRADLATVLRAAHAGATRFSAGWLVQAVLPDGSCVAARGPEQRLVAPGRYVNLQRPAVPVAPGEEVAVARVIDRVDDETRWWGCQSERGEPPAPLGRHYLHPALEAGPGVVHALTAALLDLPEPWALKCPLDAAGWRRPDALVVYAPRAATPQVRVVVEELACRWQPQLLAHLPPLTEPVGHLASYAEDPGGEHSFGSRLCRALAPGAVALATGTTTGAQALEVLAGALRAAGIDPARPWLAPRDG